MSELYRTSNVFNVECHKYAVPLQQIGRICPESNGSQIPLPVNSQYIFKSGELLSFREFILVQPHVERNFLSLPNNSPCFMWFRITHLIFWLFTNIYFRKASM